ncbi:MAG: hypothetical protein KJS68_02235 [Alphaproteobacteria bacterium]|nr:hypothetical protein [Alphaproteobacteria bacterium]
MTTIEGLPLLLADGTVVLYMLAIAIFFLLIGYVVGGQVMVERHSIPIQLFGQTRKISGFWGEAIVLILGAMVLIAIHVMTPAASLTGLLAKYPFTLREVIAVCAVLYFFYARSVLRQAARAEAHRGKSHHKKLFRAYVAYGPYCVTMYVAVAAGFALLVFQYMADASVISAQRVEILAQLNNLGTLHAPEQIQGAVEVAYGNILMNGNLVASSMNPVFMMIALITLMIIIVTRTPIKHAFRELPRSITQYTGIIALIVFFALTTITYYYSYAALASHSLKSISNLRPVLAHGRWEIMQRFNEIVIDLEHKQSFLGFATMVVNESGVAVIGMALLQWALSGFQLPVKNSD